MDGVNATIEFNCGEVVTGVGSIELAIKSHSNHCNCEEDSSDDN